MHRVLRDIHSALKCSLPNHDLAYTDRNNLPSLLSLDHRAPPQYPRHPTHHHQGLHPLFVFVVVVDAAHPVQPSLAQ